MQKTVFMVNAHPDDLNGSAGLAWILVEAGYTLRVIDFTRGERGLERQGVSMEACGAMRTAEEETACAMLGITPTFLHEIDGEACAPKETCQELADLMAADRPCAVITHWPVDRHIDHVMTGAATLAALRLSGIKTEVFFHNQTYQTLNMPFLRYVPFGQHIMDLKCRLLESYVCQNGHDIAERKVCEGRFWGWRCGKAPYAEVYGSYQMPDDPSPFFDELNYDILK